MPEKIYNILIYSAQGCFIAYDVAYFNEAGLALATLAIASSFFDITSFLAELPFSAVFDRTSPRTVLA